MNWRDLINGFFELGGSLAVCIGIHAIWKDRGYAGGHIVQILYFITLSSWRMFYFYSLHQSFSQTAEAFRFLANVVYFGLMLYYGRKH